MKSLSASSLALRRNASLMSFLTSRAFCADVSLMFVLDCGQPGTLTVRNSASSRRYCQSAVPVRVTEPFRALASTVVGIRLPR